MSKTLMCFVVLGCLFALIGATSSIGVIKSSGEFRVDGLAVRGNGTLFEGDLVETTAARSVVHLAGAQLTLLPDSRAKVYQDHTILEKGSELISKSLGHTVEVASLRVAPADKNSVLQLDVTGPSSVSITTTSGEADVRNAQGLLVARVMPGMPLAFNAQAASPSTVDLIGVVEVRDGNYFLTDKCANITVQLQGTDLAQYVGKRVEVNGTVNTAATAATGASEVVAVTTVNATNKKSCGPAGGGLSAGAKAAIIGGIAVVGTIAGLAAAGVIGGPSAPPVSQ